MRLLALVGLTLLLGCSDMWVGERGCEYCDCFDDGSCRGGLVCDHWKNCVPPDALGFWEDSTSGVVLRWEIWPSGKKKWGDASAYCDDLEWAGESDWRLPTISELRSLIRGCPDNQTGGACGVTDTCLAYTPCFQDCGGCAYDAGPGAGNCYWDINGETNCYSYWSSSTDADDISNAWTVNFARGDVAHTSKGSEISVRCVR